MPKMPQHYIASILLTSKRLQTRERIQLNQQSYSRFSPENKRERNGIESIKQPDCHKEAIPLTIRVQVGTVVNQYDTKQEIVDHTLDHLSECFCLGYSALCYQGQLFNNLVSWGAQNAPNKSSRERMSTHPTPMSGQRRYCRKHIIPFHVCPVLR